MLKRLRDFKGMGGTMSNPNQMRGRLGEEAARDYLQRQGWILLAARYHTRAGELDLVMKDGPVLVFVEVKARTGALYWDEAIGKKKAVHLYKAAEIYIDKEKPDFIETRFDAVYVMLGNRGTVVEIGHRPNFF